VIPPRCSFVTLAVRDLPRMRRFYASLGWPEASGNDDSHAAFQLGGAVLGLYGAENYADSHGPAPEPGGFRGFRLAINVESPEDVDRVHAALQQVEGVRRLTPPEDLPYGRGFSWADPEDYVWDVVHAFGTSFDQRGGLIFP
jgi:uncharacterized protein